MSAQVAGILIPVVEACFDDIERWEQENGLTPPAS